MKFEAVVAIVFFFLVVVVPVLAFTARATLPPLLDAAFRVAAVLPVRADSDLEQRIRRLEADADLLRSDLDSLRQVNSFDRALEVTAASSQRPRIPFIESPSLDNRPDIGPRGRS